MKNNVLFLLLAASLLTACSSTKNPSASMVTSGKTENGAETASANSGNVAQKAAAASFSGSSVYFEYDSAEVKGSFRPAIGDQARFLSGHPDAQVVVDGNCDERGSAEYNLSLGQRRADTLGKMLVTLGAHKSQIKTVSHGKENPKASCHDESCWKENRRADITQG
jgi:peptidoglycan-associated lipoprotein